LSWIQLYLWHVHFSTLSKIQPNGINQHSGGKALDANLKFIEPKFNFTLALVYFEIFFVIQCMDAIMVDKTEVGFSTANITVQTR
jgi:hypothetical protein